MKNAEDKDKARAARRRLQTWRSYLVKGKLYKWVLPSAPFSSSAGVAGVCLFLRFISDPFFNKDVFVLAEFLDPQGRIKLVATSYYDVEDLWERIDKPTQNQ